MQTAAAVAGFTADAVTPLLLGIKGLLYQITVIQRVMTGSTGGLSRTMRAVRTAIWFGIAVSFIRAGSLWTSSALFFALAGSLMVSYVRACAEGLGEECKVGFMQRPERIIAIGVGALVGSIGLTVAIWGIAVLANLTAGAGVLYVRKQSRS